MENQQKFLEGFLELYKLDVNVFTSLEAIPSSDKYGFTMLVSSKILIYHKKILHCCRASDYISVIILITIVLVKYELHYKVKNIEDLI